MTLQELRVFLGEWFCGCGNPEIALRRLRDLLAIHPLYDHRPEFKDMIPDDGTQYLVLYMLDRMELTEHGVSVGGAWLTDKGKAVLEAIDTFGVEKATEQCCIHGNGLDDACPQCSLLSARAEAPDGSEA